VLVVASLELKAESAALGTLQSAHSNDACPSSRGSSWYWVAMSVAFSPDGKTIVSGSADKTIKVWDANPRLFDASEWEEVDIISHPYPTITVHLFPLIKEELGYLRSNYWRNKVTRGLRKEYSTAGAHLDPRTDQSLMGCRCVSIDSPEPQPTTDRSPACCSIPGAQGGEAERTQRSVFG